MKCVVVYDSMYGNTEKIAKAIANAFVSSRAVRADEAGAEMLEKIDIMFIGSPTHGGRPTENILKFVDSISAGRFRNLKAGVFDTRVKYEDQNFALKLLLRVIGYAGSKTAALLRGKGVEVVEPIEGFIVNGREGPLANGEIERAVKWARIAAKL